MVGRAWTVLATAGMAALSLTCGCKKKGSVRRYLDPEGRFSIDVPSSWKVRQVKGQKVIVPRGPDEDPAALAIAIARHEDPDDTLEEAAERVLSRFKKNAAMRLVDSGQAEINGKQAVRISFAKRAPPAGELQIAVYIILWEGNAIILNLVAKPGSSRWTALEGMLNSFTLGD